MTGKRTSQIPQEAVIGISYVVAAAAAVLLLSRAAEGDEEIKNMLVGNILLVTPREVWKCFALLSPSAFCISFCAEISCSSRSIATRAYQKDLRVRWWDFLFYAVFGLVVTSFVRIAGVLLVFSYLDRAGGLRNQSGTDEPRIVCSSAGSSRFSAESQDCFCPIGGTYLPAQQSSAHLAALLILISLFALWQHQSSSFCGDSGLIRQRRR